MNREKSSNKTEDFCQKGVSEISRTPTVAITSNTAWSIFNFRQGLIKALQNKGYRVVVFAPYDEYAPRIASDLICQYFEVKMQSSGTNPFQEIQVVWRYWKLLKQQRPCVFLTFTPKPNIYGAIAARGAGVPVISNVSGLGRAFIHRNWVTSIVERLYRVAINYPEKVFFQNSDDKTIFLEHGFVHEGRAFLLPGSGVDTEKFAPALKAPMSGPFVFMMVARMLRDKGVGEFVEAARIVKKTNPQAKFHLVGFLDIDNPSAVSRAEMEQWVTEGVIDYLGPTDDVKAFFSKADCVVLPSYREGTPRSLLEAASMALPIITTDAPGCRDTVDAGITGYICDVKDPSGLADCMLKMLSLSPYERQQMGTAGRRKMLQQFSESIVIDAYLSAVEELVSDDTLSQLPLTPLLTEEQLNPADLASSGPKHHQAM